MPQAPIWVKRKKPCNGCKKVGVPCMVLKEGTGRGKSCERCRKHRTKCMVGNEPISKIRQRNTGVQEEADQGENVEDDDDEDDDDDDEGEGVGEGEGEDDEDGDDNDDGEDSEEDGDNEDEPDIYGNPDHTLGMMVQFTAATDIENDFRSNTRHLAVVRDNMYASALRINKVAETFDRFSTKMSHDLAEQVLHLSRASHFDLTEMSCALPKPHSPKASSSHKPLSPNQHSDEESNPQRGSRTSSNEETM